LIKRIVNKLVYYIAAVVLFFTVCTATRLWYDGFKDVQGRAGLAIVECSQSNETDSLSKQTIGCLEVAVNLYGRGRNKHTLVSNIPYGMQPKQKQRIRKWLLDNKMPDSTLYFDTISTTAAANVKYAASLMKQHHWERPSLIAPFYKIGIMKYYVKKEKLTWPATQHGNYYDKQDYKAFFKEIGLYLFNRMGFVD
jgi:hypothetical protein